MPGLAARSTPKRMDIGCTDVPKDLPLSLDDLPACLPCLPEPDGCGHWLTRGGSHWHRDNPCARELEPRAKKGSKVQHCNLPPDPTSSLLAAWPGTVTWRGLGLGSRRSPPLFPTPSFPKVRPLPSMTEPVSVGRLLLTCVDHVCALHVTCISSFRPCDCQISHFLGSKTLA